MLRHSTAIAVFCALAASQAATAQDTVRLGNLKFAHYGAVSYMKEICGKYNIKVEERMFAKGPDIMPAIVADEVDIAASGADASISARANGVPIYVVAGFAKGGVRIVAQAESGIKTLGDLKGKKVGITRGTPTELLLLAELEKRGLSWSDQPGKDVQLVYLSFPDLNQALAGKQIDAMSQSEPQSAQAIRKKFGIELMKPYDTPMGEPVRTLVMSEKLYNNRDVAGRLMKCFVEATSTFNKNPQLAEKYVRENLFKGQLSAEDFQDAMSNADYTYDITALHLDVTTHFMQKYGIGHWAKTPKAVDWVKLDLLQQAKNELKVK